MQKEKEQIRTPSEARARIDQDVQRIHTVGDLLSYLQQPREHGFHSPEAGSLILDALEILMDNPRRRDRRYDLDKLRFRDRVIQFRGAPKPSTRLYAMLFIAILRLIEIFEEEHKRSRKRWIEKHPLEYAREFLGALYPQARRYANWEERREWLRKETGYYDE